VKKKYKLHEDYDKAGSEREIICLEVRREI
jgi:hypothetical protein